MMATDDEMFARLVEHAPHAIDHDPEFYHGLTWNDDEAMVAAQIQGPESGLKIHDKQDGKDVDLTPAEARRLRDLLNVATARGFL